MDLKDDYPEDKWPDGLKKAVETRRKWELVFYFWYLPYNALRRWLESKYDATNPAWGESHYEGWSNHDLMWRIQFLQGAGRSLWVEREFWRRYAGPVLLFAAVVAGMLIGRFLRAPL